MEFNNHETQFLGRKQLIKVDANNVPIDGEEPIFVNIVKEEGEVIIRGTPVSADNLNKGNWRDENSISFMKRDDDSLPDAKIGETQIATKANGETWIIPPRDLGGNIKVASSGGTLIRIEEDPADEIVFSRDPQTQITDAWDEIVAVRHIAETAHGLANGKSAVYFKNGGKTDLEFKSDPQEQLDNKSTIWIDDKPTDVEFKSDPQEQLDLKADKTAFEGVSQAFTLHSEDKSVHLNSDTIDATFPQVPSHTKVPSTKLVKEDLAAKDALISDLKSSVTSIHSSIAGINSKVSGTLRFVRILDEAEGKMAPLPLTMPTMTTAGPAFWIVTAYDTRSARSFSFMTAFMGGRGNVSMNCPVPYHTIGESGPPPGYDVSARLTLSGDTITLEFMARHVSSSGSTDWYIDNSPFRVVDIWQSTYN